MKPVMQLEENGCGVACVAFVACRSYWCAKRRYFEGVPGDPSTSGRGYMRRAMRRALLCATGLEFAERRRLRDLSERANRGRLPPGAIGLFEWTDGDRHYVVRVDSVHWMDPLRARFRREVPNDWRLIGFLTPPISTS